MLLIIVIGLLMVGAVWWAMATAEALSEGRASTITANAPEILDCCRHLAAHFSASATVEVVERNGLIDLIFRNPK